MKIKVRNTSGLPLPEYKTFGAAGMDLLANINEDLTLLPGTRHLVPTGLYVEIPIGFEGQVRPRSGLAIKYGVTLINCVGTVDSDYRGELKVPMVNLGENAFVIHRGDRIAQMIITRYEKAQWLEVEVLEDSERGTGGFGSTGI